MKRYSECSGGIVLNDYHEIVMIKQVGGSWSFPKGHVDKGEDLLATAYREIEEESGIIDLTFIQSLGSYQRSAIKTDGTFDENEIKRIHLFLFTTSKHRLTPKQLDSLDAKWIPKVDVEDLLTHPKDKEYFKSIINKIKIKHGK
jgi:bis(5'-nucleosidyl)-tetraphosphatase